MQPTRAEPAPLPPSTLPQMFPVYQVPPVSTAATMAVWTAILSATNGKVCGSALLQQPVDTWHMSVWYHALEPLLSPLEPLLLAAGIGSDHPGRRCHGGAYGERRLACGTCVARCAALPMPACMGSEGCLPWQRG